MTGQTMWREAALEWEKAKVARLEERMAVVRADLRKLQKERRCIVNRAAWRSAWRRYSRVGRVGT